MQYDESGLTKQTQYPHLIVPIDSSKPDTAFGTSYNGTVSATVSSIFNFDVKASDAGKTCSLIFLFPWQSQLETSSYEVAGNGSIDFYMLNSPATTGTTFKNVPAVKTEYGMAKLEPGHSYSVANFPCPGGSAIGIKAEACGDTYLNYFQDYNPSRKSLISFTANEMTADQETSHWTLPFNMLSYGGMVSYSKE